MDSIATYGYLRMGPRERGGAAAGAAAATALLGVLLILGLRVAVTAPSPEPVILLDLAPDSPRREKKPPEPKRSHQRQGAPSPPNLRSEPTEIVAPTQAPTPTPVVAAPVAGTGSAPSAGAAEIAGPGTGAGGEGDGRGAGGEGDGAGDGSGETPPRLRRGRLRDSDYPRAAGEAGAGGTVSVRYVVWTDGRVTECEVTKSSGNATLDETTCRLIRERFRFEPSRDARGRAVPSVIVENHSWSVHDDPPEPKRR